MVAEAVGYRVGYIARKTARAYLYAAYYLCVVLFLGGAGGYLFVVLERAEVHHALVLVAGGADQFLGPRAAAVNIVGIYSRLHAGARLVVIGAHHVTCIVFVVAFGVGGGLVAVVVVSEAR